MLRLSLSLASLALAGCASVPSSELIVTDTPEVRPDAGSRAEPASLPVTSLPVTETSATSALVAPATLPPAEPGPLLAAEESLHGSRFTIKGGLYSADAEELDDGYIINASWMRFFSKLLALEFELGYLDADGDDAGANVDVWAMPIMVNGRANIPVWLFDLYGGLGLGGIYYDVEVSGAVSGDDDGFLLGGNAFLGATVNLADAIALGLEGKYYVTEDADDFDESLDAFALMLTLGFSR